MRIKHISARSDWNARTRWDVDVDLDVTADTIDQAIAQVVAALTKEDTE